MAPDEQPDVNDPPGCPYSAEDVAACRYYQPVSEHSDSPGAERCRHAVQVSVSERVRRWICERVQPAVARPL